MEMGTAGEAIWVDSTLPMDTARGNAGEELRSIIELGGSRSKPRFRRVPLRRSNAAASAMRIPKPAACVPRRAISGTRNVTAASAIVATRSAAGRRQGANVDYEQPAHECQSRRRQNDQGAIRRPNPATHYGAQGAEEVTIGLRGKLGKVPPADPCLQLGLFHHRLASPEDAVPAPDKLRGELCGAPTTCSVRGRTNCQ